MIKPQTPTEPIEWTGDLSDDCSALWGILLLRAEWMDKNRWWWAISDRRCDEEIDSSNNYNENVINGEMARVKAEIAAKKFYNIPMQSPPSPNTHIVVY